MKTLVHQLNHNRILCVYEKETVNDRDILTSAKGIGMFVDHNNIEIWFKDGKVHREDGPAYISNIVRRAERWYKNGLLHREGGPAMTFSNGSKEWFRYGVRTREDGPAAINADGSFSWYWKDNYCPSFDIWCEYAKFSLPEDELVFLKLKYGT